MISPGNIGTVRIFHTVAVLELKRRGVLRRDDFESAKADAANREAKIEESYANMLSNDADAEATNFEGNAFWLSKQAAAYAIEQETQFVGLFDWDSMFLFRFGEFNPGEEGVGESAYGTWVEDRNPTFFRKALFGFLVAACEVNIEPPSSEEEEEEEGGGEGEGEGEEKGDSS